MILKTLYDYAQDENLAEGMDVSDRLVHLVLTLNTDGSVLGNDPWQSLSRPVTNPKTGKTKEELGRSLKMPATPIVLAGGKAYFLADACEKVLGLNPKTGDPVPDDPGQGGNPSKGFQHFWQRIADAYEESRFPELKTLLDFRDRYLLNEDTRRSIPFVETVPIGSSGKPTLAPKPRASPFPSNQRRSPSGSVLSEPPYSRKTLPSTNTGSKLSTANALPRLPTPLSPHRPTEAPASSPASKTSPLPTSTAPSSRAFAACHPSAAISSRSTPPPPRSRPSASSAAGTLQSSEKAAAAYALALNHLLANDLCRRSFGDAVLVSWVDLDPETTGNINNLLVEGIPSEASVKDYFEKFEKGNKDHLHLKTRFFHSMTLAANGGRIVVRRWLDTPLPRVVNALKQWFSDLEIEAIQVPRKSPKIAGRSRKRSPEPEIQNADSPEASTAPPPYSMFALASTTARVPSEVPTSVYDALYRAALEESNPQALLAPVLHRLRIAATQSGNGIRFHTSRFALIKLILIRSKEFPMEAPSEGEEIRDVAYNCGQLLAVLDDMQLAAQGRVGADVVARFYGNASTFPRNVFQRLLRLEKHHRAKLLKSSNPSLRAAGFALGSRLDAICLLFPSKEPGASPEFPGLLTPQQQGRFALGFHRQKALDELRRRKAAEARKAAGSKTPLDPELAGDQAIAEVFESPEESD